MHTKENYSQVWIEKFFVIILIAGSILAGNYPNEITHSKPCIQPKHTINQNLPLCQSADEAATGIIFVQETMDNCKKLLESCPEFNQWQCMWFDYHSCKYPAGPIKLLTCRLKYYAKGYTWAEVYYINQYGTNGSKSSNAIVEVSRNVLKHSVFGPGQPEWPLSVLNPQGDRGLPWETLKTPMAPIDTYIRPEKNGLCFNLSDAQQNCAVHLVKYLTDNYADGFHKERIPASTAKETSANATVTIEISGRCDYAMIGQVKTPACFLPYVRHSKYSYVMPGLVEVPINRDIRQEFLEAQIYETQVGGKKSLTMRFAYLNYVPPQDH